MYQEYLNNKNILDKRLSKPVKQRQLNLSLPIMAQKVIDKQKLLQSKQQIKSLGDKLNLLSDSIKKICVIAQSKVALISTAGIGLLSLIGYLKQKSDMKYNPAIGGVSSSPVLYTEKSSTDVIKNKIIKEAHKQKVDPSLALAVAQQESGFNPKATSPAGAKGIFQLMPKTAQSVGVTDAYDIDQNIQGGVKYLKWCLDNTNTVEEALVAYNAGIGNLNKAKKAGKKIDSITDNGKYAQDVLNKQKTYKQELNKGRDIVTRSTSAGNIRRLDNGTMIDGYKMANPVQHNGKYYIDLSQRAEAYLRDVGGQGLVTSGAEGSHAKGKVSHASGNKVDIVAFKDTDEQWADTAIPFIKNTNTAYINFEDFTEQRFNNIKKIIYSKISQDLINKCESSVKYSFGPGKKFLFRYHTGGGLHLDIGILPYAYSSYQQAQQNKNNTIVSDNKKQKSVQDTVPTTPKQETSKNMSQNTPQQTQSQTKTLQGIDTNRVNVLGARNLSKSNRKS